MKKIAIFGAGGFGREVKFLIDEINQVRNEWEFIGYFDDNLSNVKKIEKKYLLGDTQTLNNWNEKISLAVAIGLSETRKKIVSKIKNPMIGFPTLIHPNAIISDSNVMIGSGGIICAGCIITVDIKLGQFVNMHISSTVSHDCIIEDFCSLMPAVNISGEVSMKQGVYLGTGAKVINQVTIGEGVIIGAGSIVTKSLPSRCIAVGVPAKPIKFMQT